MRIYGRSVAILFYLPVLTVCDPCLGDLLVGTAFEGGVRRLNETTGAPLPGGIAPGSAGLDLTSGVTVGPDGNIYVSSRGTGEVLFYDGDSGTPLPSPHAGGRPGLFATLATEETPTSTPGPLRFGPDGHLYVSDFGGNQVRKYNGSTGVELAPAATVFAGPPAGLVFDPNGDLFVGDFGSASVIRFSNGVPSFHVAPQTGGLLTPSSLLFAPNGDLWVVDLYGNKLLGFDPSGEDVTLSIDIPPPIPDPLPPGANFPSNNPSDMALDGDGNLYIAVLGLTNPPDNRGAIMRLDPEGILTTVVDMQTPFGSIAIIDPADFPFGDYDRNGVVELADHGEWASTFGDSVFSFDGADGNGNGVIDAADYVIWREAMEGSPPEINATAIPEPVAIVPFATAAIGALGIRRRRR